jgi:chromosome segregation ATPase
MANTGQTLKQIDESLEKAQAAVARLGTALFELDAEKERRTAELQDLTGSSRAAWDQTGLQLSVLWAWYQALTGVVEEISDRRQAPSPRPADLNEMSTLLSTASVEVPADSRDLAQQCLPQLEALPEKAPIAVMVRVISAAYQAVAETITSIFALRDMALPRLAELDAALSQATQAARAVGVRLPNEALAVRRQLDELGRRAARDPLSIDVQQIPALDAAVERVRAELAEATGALANVDESFASLGSSLEAADDDIREAGKAVETATVKIAGVKVGRDDVLVLERAASGLRSALEEVRQNAAADRPAADRAARALEPRIAALRADAEHLSAAASEPMAMRQELRGRLDAYRAKAHSLGRGEDAFLDRLYRAAQDVLYTAPCDLAASERRLAAYQAAVLASPVEDRLT